jgi:hypothetical protein
MISSMEDEFHLQLDLAALDAEQITVPRIAVSVRSGKRQPHLSCSKALLWFTEYRATLSNENIFLYGFNHKLESIRRDLNQLQTEGLLLGSPEALSALGYQYNFGIGKNETLLSLATDPLSRAGLQRIDLKGINMPCSF